MANPTYGTTTSANASSGERVPFSSIPKRWPLVTTDQHRSAVTAQLNKDARLVNCFAEQEPQTGDYGIDKRPGYGDSVQISPAAANGRGVYTRTTDVNVYSVFGNKLYNATTAVIGTVDAHSIYTWAEIQGGSGYLVLGNGVKGYYTDGINVTQIADPDFPAGFCLGLVYLDGTLYVMRPDGGIQGSAIDDPTTWDPLNLIFARSAPGRGVYLIKHLTYVVALKNTSTEAFYDAGNPTGSPLAKVEGAFIPMGCAAAESVAEIDGMHFWLGRRLGTTPTIQLVQLENLQLTVVSTPPAERILTALFLANTGSVYGYVLKISGHRFYIVTSLLYPFAMVYDIDQKLFYQWFKEDEAIWPFMSTATGQVNGNIFQWTQHYLTGKLYKTDTDFVYPTDDGVLIPVDIYTPNVDFGIRRTKQLNGMLFSADQVDGSELLVRSSDDDYDSWTNFRHVNLSIRQPFLGGLGSFFKRAYNFRHRGRTSFGIQSVDLQMDIGTF